VSDKTTAMAQQILARMFMGEGLMAPKPAMFGQGLMYQPDPMPPQYRTPAMLNAVGAGPVAMTQPGNIDIFNRPTPTNPEGGISTVRSASFQDESGQEVLIPTIGPNGAFLTPEQAWRLYQITGKHLGKFPNPNAANYFSNALHNQQDRFYNKRPKK
jgi:hypothetical protein